MRNFFQRHYDLWQHRWFIISAISGLLFLVISTMLNYASETYAFHAISNSVSDLILDKLPIIKVNFIFIEGAAAMAIYALVLCIHEPKFIPFASKSVGLLYLFRAISLTLTHLGPPMGMQEIILGNTLLDRFVYGTDYFFSGHTALPLMFALVFWHYKKSRYFFFACMLVFAISSLLGHLHYSIDVFAAPFISYSTYVLTAKLFPKDYDLIN